MAQEARGRDEPQARRRRAAAEACGTCLLLVAVVGSGIMGERLAGTNAALALFANSTATGAALAALLAAFAPISGAHLNPLVTVAVATRGEIDWREVPGYVLAQSLGALAGVALANAMFGEPWIGTAQQARAGLPLLLGEVVATAGLLIVALTTSRHRPAATPWAVAAYIAGAYWFTSSTSFANPAVTFARAWTDSFTGIRLDHVPGFVVAQLVGAALAVGLLRGLVPVRREG
jgi:glycerol uptake facilitator-like aquaporin